MQKLTFQRNKYGKEILIDTANTSEFAVDKMEVLLQAVIFPERVNILLKVTKNW